MGSGSDSLFDDLPYALGGFSRVPAVRAVTPPSPIDARRKRGHSSVSEHFHNLGGAGAAGGAGANYLSDGRHRYV